ncbi:PREDICTED: centromere protein F [Condylura cristata]|uniref:centromere protein F n=1 Tax=Condylura cristata TaxID=143302 RepID=UPI0006429B4F|nr:PREDICTED: centromere protein F [Condylura cristata]
MSWALEEWKEGLPTRALQKIQELEGQLDKLKKERQQRQFQLETLEAALQTQKRKVENEKTEGINLKRENQSLVEICESLEKAKQKISHDLQVKESQVNFQEGQLSASRKQIEKLEQELKRCKSELERSQQAVHSADVSLNPCSTPQKMFATPLTPSHYYSGSKYEELKEKYDKEVEERKRLEAEVKVLQAKRVSQPPPQSTMNHRDIARHQASSTVFSWQWEDTPSRLSSSALKTPGRRELSAAHAPGEGEGTPGRWTPQAGVRNAGGGACDNASNSQLPDQLKAQNQELRSKIHELEQRLQGQEKELKGQGARFQELRLQLEKATTELADKEKVLNKSRDELVRTTAQSDQASAKCAALEQKLKRLTEDLSCQRQNAESARCSLEQRSKEKEKEFQEELCRQQRALQALEQEGAQVKARLTQELQQARSAQGSLQAELDRVTAAKHQLEKSLDEFKHKFCRAEQALQASQTQEDALRRSVELPAPGCRLDSLCRSRSLARWPGAVPGLRGILQPVLSHLGFPASRSRKGRWLPARGGECLPPACWPVSLGAVAPTADGSRPAWCGRPEGKLERLYSSRVWAADTKVLLGAARSRSLLLAIWGRGHPGAVAIQGTGLQAKAAAKAVSQEGLLRDLQEKISQQENPLLLEKLRRAVADLEQQRDCSQDLLKKREHHIEQLNEKLSRTEQESRAVLSALECKSKECEELSQEKTQFSLWKQENEQRLHQVAAERESLQGQVSHLETCLRTQQARSLECSERLAALELELELDQKRRAEMDSVCSEVARLQGQVADLERELQVLSGELADREQRCQDLSAQCESLRGAGRSGGPPLGAGPAQQAHGGSVPAFEQQPAGHDPLASLAGQQEGLPSERSHAAPSPSGSGILHDKVAALECSLESQKQRNSDLQRQCEELVQVRAETEENLRQAEQLHQDFVAATSQRISKLQEDNSLHQQVVAETVGALKDKEKELQLLTEQLEAQQAETREAEVRSRSLEAAVKELQLLSETLSSEKKEMSAVISLRAEEIHELAQENGRLKEVNASLGQEKRDLLQKSERLSLLVEEKERSLSELSSQHQQERLALLQRCAEARSALEELSAKYEAGQEQSSQLECLLSRCTGVCENRERELERLREAFAREHQACVAELALAEERNQRLERELEAAQRRAAEPPSRPQGEAEAPEQAIRALEEEQTAAQRQVQALSQESPHLRESAQTQSERPDPQPRPAEEHAGCATECGHAPLQAALAASDPSPDRRGELRRSEAQAGNLELRLQGRELDKERLRPESPAAKDPASARDPRPAEASAPQDAPQDCDMDAEGECASPHGEWPAGGPLQAALSKLAELEALCGSLRAEKLELLSELDAARSECVEATSKMAAEVEKLVGEVRTLNHAGSLLHSELVTEATEVPAATFGAEHTPASPAPPGDSSFSERLASSGREVQAHFAELQARVTSLQREHRALHHQHCQVRSRMAALQAYVGTLQANTSASYVDPRDAEGDAAKEVTPGPREGRCLWDSPCPAGLRELTAETSLLSHSEGDDVTDQSRADDTLSSSLGEEALAPGGPPPPPGERVEALEARCQTYLQSLRQLEEKMEREGLLRNEEMQALRQLLGSGRDALDGLRREYLSERQQWEQRLARVTADMECRLAAEKQQTEQLARELEVARLQLQGLDLSSRSLLGADLEDVSTRGAAASRHRPPESKPVAPPAPGSESCDSKEPEGNTSGSGEGAHGRGPHAPCDDQPGLPQSQGGAQPQTPRRQRDSLGGRPPAGSPEPSPAGPGAPDLLDFPGSPVTGEKLRARVQEMSRENARLRQAVEERDRRVEGLLGEVEELGSKLELQEAQVAAQTAACLQLEGVVGRLEEEKSAFSEQSDPPADAEQRPPAGAGAAPANAGWRERFLSVEKELERLSAQHAGLERQALSLGAALERAQREKLSLAEDSARKGQVIARLERQLSGGAPLPGGAVSTLARRESGLQRDVQELAQKMAAMEEDLSGEKSRLTEELRLKSEEIKSSDVAPASCLEDKRSHGRRVKLARSRGFADIPTGKTSPYILRRTTLATRTSPRLAAQKLAPSPLSLDKENQAEPSKPAAGGSRSQKLGSADCCWKLLEQLQEFRL